MGVPAGCEELEQASDATSRRKPLTGAIVVLLIVPIVAGALWLRIYRLDRIPLWVDEAESCLNALTILQRGYPGNSYLGQPIFENTLTIPSPDDPEYEFRDSSYGRHGLALYHGWLPLYSIAGVFRLSGVTPDPPGALAPRYDARERRYRTVVARIPGVLFGMLSILGLFLAALRLHSRNAGLVAASIASLLSVHINFSRQARYYAPTLAAAAFCAWAIARMAQRGRRRDYVVGAVLFAALFHTHILSFVIAAIVLAIYAVCARDRFSLPRLAGFAAIVAALCVPWIAATGLLSQMSGIPPAWKLMSFPRDLFIRRVVESEFGATVFIGLVLLIIGTFLRRWRIGRRIAAVFTPDMEAFALMYCWLIVGYIGFIFLTPAASFWITRLALTLLVPTILVIAMLLCSLGSLIDARRPWLPAAIGALVFVLASNHLHHPEPTESQAAQSVRDLDAVVNYLHEAHLRPGTRLFATPNDHLVLTFYTGLPVQSIAPVRKSFLDSYPGDVIFFERESLIPTDAIEPEALQIAAGPGRHLTDEQARDISCEIASYSYRQTLAARVAGVFPPLSPIPTFARQSAVDYLEELRDRGERINRIIQDSTLIFRKTRIESGFDWWNEFFYAFVNPEWRKAHPNYRDRMRDATAAVLACTDSVVYFSPGRAAR